VIAFLERYKSSGSAKDRSDAFGMLRTAVAATSATPLERWGLFDGAPGLALAMTECAREDERFMRSAKRFHNKIVDRVLETDLEFATSTAPTAAFYDVISGLSGILIYLATSPWRTFSTRAAVDHVGHRLDVLVRSAELEESFFLRPPFSAGTTYAERYPRGLVDAGYAHGLPGVALALATAKSSGLSSIDHTSSIRTLVAWLRHQRDAQTGLSPRALSIAGDGGRLEPDFDAARQGAWCYGSAGVGIALSRAGTALGDADIVANGTNLVLAGADDHLAELSDSRILPDLGLCHGLSGLALILQEVTAIAPSAAADEILRAVVEALYAALEDQMASPGKDQTHLDSIHHDTTFLTGTAGIETAILCLNDRDRPSWLSVFLGAPA
jgi:hypothetical protein